MLKSVRLSIVATGLILMPLATYGQEAPKEQFEAALANAILPITRSEDGSLNGPGYERLIAEADKAQFFLIGENHATADIALVETRLHAALANRGFDYMAIEVGPWSTRHVETMIRNGPGELEAFIATSGNEFTIPFLFFREELALVEQGVLLSTVDDNALWGLDQEFLGAASLLLNDLERVAESDREKAAVQRFAESAMANPMFLGAAPDSELDALEGGFADGSDEADRLVADIRLTHRIYGPFMRRTGPIYPANLERENYMKSNFLEHFNAAEERDGKSPKVFFKFGGYHMERGLSGTNVPSLGNFVMEWGRARGFRTVHLMIDCVGGEAFAIMVGQPQPCEPYALDDGSPVLSAIDGHDMVLIDLASLRPLVGSRSTVDQRTKDLIFSFDYLVAIRGVSASTPVAKLTLPEM